MSVGQPVRSASVPHFDGVAEELGRRAPAWVPDTASTACQECCRSFSFLVRRHHCRACGRLLCDPCCGHTYPLQYLGWAPARVCLACKEQLDGPGRPPRRSRSLSGMAEETVARLVREMQIESSRRRILSGPDCRHQGEEEEGTMPHVERLPPEILSKIFDLLGHSDKMACRSVCHHWLEAIETSQFHRDNIIHVEEGQQENLPAILSTFSTSPRQFRNFRFSNLSLTSSSSSSMHLWASLRTLELHSCQVSEKDLVAILGQARRLHTLALVNCRETFMSGNFLSNPAELATMRQSLAGLRSLRLDSNRYLSDVLLMRISETTPVLEHLSLSDCSLLNDAGIYRKHYPASQQLVASPSVLTWRIVVRVVQRLAPTLTSLNVARNAGVDLEMLSGVEGLHLTSLNLTNCNAVTQEGFRQLLAACSGLSVLGLAGCRRLLAGLREATRTICQDLVGLQQLTSLNLSNLSVPHFSEVGALRHLDHLVVDSLDAPGGEIVAGLRRLNLGRLVELQARYLSVASQDLLELIATTKFPRLRRLDLSHGCQNVITDQIFLAICTSMPGLLHLNLANNPLLSDTGAVGPPPMEPPPSAVTGQQVDTGQEDNCPSSDRPGLWLLSRLVSLDLSATAVSERTLRQGIAAPDLRRLSLNQCGRVEDGGLCQLVLRHPRLERLELRACRLTDTGLVTSLSCLPRLVHLDLSNCGYVTSSGVRAMEQVSPQLETLLLSNCPGVSVEAARTLETALPYLKRLETHGLQLDRDRMAFSSFIRPAPPPPPPPPHR